MKYNKIYSKKKTATECGGTYLNPRLSGQNQVNLHDFEATLLYIVNSRLPRAKDPVTKEGARGREGWQGAVCVGWGRAANTKLGVYMSFSTLETEAGEL